MFGTQCSILDGVLNTWHNIAFRLKKMVDLGYHVWSPRMCCRDADISLIVQRIQSCLPARVNASEMSLLSSEVNLMPLADNWVSMLGPNCP